MKTLIVLCLLVAAISAMPNPVEKVLYNVDPFFYGGNQGPVVDPGFYVQPGGSNGYNNGVNVVEQPSNNGVNVVDGPVNPDGSFSYNPGPPAYPNNQGQGQVIIPNPDPFYNQGGQGGQIINPDPGFYQQPSIGPTYVQPSPYGYPYRPTNNGVLRTG